MKIDFVEKPLMRAPWRRRLGREYYILKRKMRDILGGTKWAKRRRVTTTFYPIKEHSSMILRPLKDVEMYLQENKRTNLKLAIKHLNGIMIRPGETFSVWHKVGRPTASKGYLEGLVLHQGQVTKGVGGGLCQLGNLLFWMFAHTPLRITERHRHSFDVFPDVNRNVPFGAGATLSYNYIDLRVYNPTEKTYLVELWTDETHLHGRVSADVPQQESYRIEERDHRVVTQYWGGYTRHNRIVQVITHPDGREHEQLLVENHAIMMYNPMLSPPANAEFETNAAPRD